MQAAVKGNLLSATKRLMTLSASAIKSRYAGFSITDAPRPRIQCAEEYRAMPQRTGKRSLAWQDNHQSDGMNRHRMPTSRLHDGELRNGAEIITRSPRSECFGGE